MTEATEKANGAPPAPKRGDAPRTWPNTVTAASLTGLTRKQLEKLASTGALKVEKDTGGVWRWDPELLAIVAESRGDVDDDDDDAPAPVAGKAQLAAETVALLRQAHSHQESTLRTVLDPARLLLAALQEENERLRKRCDSLERKHDAMVEAREKLLNEQHLRDLVTAEAAQSAARKDKALKLFEGLAPKLLAAINPKATAVVDLLQSLTVEQRDLLLLTDLLSPEQKQQVRGLLEASKPPVAPESAEPKESST